MQFFDSDNLKLIRENSFFGDQFFFNNSSSEGKRSRLCFRNFLCIFKFLLLTWTNAIPRPAPPSWTAWDAMNLPKEARHPVLYSDPSLVLIVQILVPDSPLMALQHFIGRFPPGITGSQSSGPSVPQHVNYITEYTFVYFKMFHYGWILKFITKLRHSIRKLKIYYKKIQSEMIAIANDCNF